MDDTQTHPFWTRNRIPSMTCWLNSSAPLVRLAVEKNDTGGCLHPEQSHCTTPHYYFMSQDQLSEQKLTATTIHYSHPHALSLYFCFTALTFLYFCPFIHCCISLFIVLLFFILVFTLLTMLDCTANLILLTSASYIYYCYTICNTLHSYTAFVIFTLSIHLCVHYLYHLSIRVLGKQEPIPADFS